MSDHPTSPPHRWPLEPDESTIRSWLSEITDLLLEHLKSLPDQPAANLENVEGLLPDLVEDLPEEGAQATDLFRKIVKEYVPASFNTAGPGYLAYIPGGGIVPAALADLIADVTNRFVGIFAAAPLLVRLETTTLRWFLDMVEFPASARGILTSGGSIANLTALVCARTKILGDDFGNGMIYVSDQVHHSIIKSARFVGFRKEQVRVVPTDEDFRMDIDALSRNISSDLAHGHRPAIAISSAGTTNTGAVDDLGAISEIAARHGLWHHIDAAYGGFFRLTERGRSILSAMPAADSITIDPHKGLFLPYGTGCLLVKNGEDLRAPHSSETDYLPPQPDNPLAQDFSEYSPELSRDFRGLRIWLPLKIFGARAFRECLDEKLDLAAYAAEELQKIENLRVLFPPQLSLVSFRVTNSAGEDDDEASQELLRRIIARGRVMMSNSHVKGRWTLRICILNFRTHRERLEEALQIIREEASSLD